ncbi:MAG: hypothetical protein JWN43_3139, partial [Gammaproteobacteria bacterium]|nr:hypothetical protein [Gammaproteobacteria bacterium]
MKRSIVRILAVHCVLILGAALSNPTPAGAAQKKPPTIKDL